MHEPALPNLQAAMQRKVPRATLKRTPLPLVAEIELMLIDGAYPQSELTVEQVNELMDHPPYWAFCWASGQVMARYLLDQPELVLGKTVVDFGCGSGVVAIAASLAGAAQSVAADIDSNALLASRINAELNTAKIALSDNEATLAIDKSNAVVLVADVFYDAANIPLLQRFIRDYGDVIIADSRVKPSMLRGVYEVARYSSCTVPDLDEASAFNSVGLYRLTSDTVGNLEKY